MPPPDQTMNHLALFAPQLHHDRARPTKLSQWTTKIPKSSRRTYIWEFNDFSTNKDSLITKYQINFINFLSHKIWSIHVSQTQCLMTTVKIMVPCQICYHTLVYISNEVALHGYAGLGSQCIQPWLQQLTNIYTAVVNYGYREQARREGITELGIWWKKNKLKS